MKAGQYSHLIMGLPGAGKTTFLAALWYVVRDRAAASALALDHVVGDTSHLNAIREHWLRCEEVPRTSTATEQLVSLFLKEKETRQPLVVHVPDFAGEHFEAQWTERQWTGKYDRLVATADGALLFVHPGKIQEPTRIDMVDDMAPGDDEPASAEGAAADDEPVWQPRESPTQVMLVELLQLIAAGRESSQPFRVAIMVSAWDKLAALKLSPERWMRKQLPLLDQWLRARAAEFPSTIYGLSAQGAEYLKTDADPLLGLNPLNRIALVGEEVVQPHDITEPLRWLMR